MADAGNSAFEQMNMPADFNRMISAITELPPIFDRMGTPMREVQRFSAWHFTATSRTV